MRLFWLPLIALVLLPACSAPRPQRAAAEVTPKPYVRIYDDQTNFIRLQIAIRKFVPTKGRGPAVWLTGVSHIGETNYFVRLQDHLDSQGLVLFEGISDRARAQFGGSGNAGEAGAAAPSEAPAEAKMSSLQSVMASSLGLAFQLEAIDYGRANFRNSDLSVQELRQLLAERGGGRSFESLLQMMEGGSFFDALIQLGLRFLGTSSTLQAFSKLALMEMIGEIGGDPGQIRGLPPDLKQLLQVLIQERNQRVLQDLRLELERKHGPSSVSIFFGTGHMPDFERRLRSEFGYRPAEEEWLTAISIDLRKTGLSRSDVKAVRTLVSGSMEQFKGAGERGQGEGAAIGNETNHQAPTSNRQ